jgi:hypothetical protein
VDRQRREFLTLLARGLGVGLGGGMAAGALLPSLAACTHQKFLSPDDDILISGGQYPVSQHIQDALIIINLQQKEKRVIDLDFLPHQVIIDPRDKYRVFCVEAGGSNACSIDIRSLQVSTGILCSEGRYFSGYAAYDSAGDNLYTVEYDIDNMQGFVTVRNPSSFEEKRVLPTLGLSPRQCLLTADNRLVINNNGQDASGFHRPSLVIIDPDTGKLVRRIRLDDKVMDVGAITSIGDDRFFIASANMSGLDNVPAALTMTDAGSLETLAPETSAGKDIAIKMARGASNVLYQDKLDSVYTCHPHSDLITRWDVGHRKMVKHLELQQPRAIAGSVDDKYVIVSYGVKASMIKLDSHDLSPLAESYVQPTHASGTYMINWSKELRRIMPKDVYS